MFPDTFRACCRKLVRFLAGLFLALGVWWVRLWRSGDSCGRHSIDSQAPTLASYDLNRSPSLLDWFSRLIIMFDNLSSLTEVLSEVGLVQRLFLCSHALRTQRLARELLFYLSKVTDGLWVACIPWKGLKLLSGTSRPHPKACGPTGLFLIWSFSLPLFSLVCPSHESLFACDPGKQSKSLFLSMLLHLDWRSGTRQLLSQAAEQVHDSCSSWAYLSSLLTDATSSCWQGCSRVTLSIKLAGTL